MNKNRFREYPYRRFSSVYILKKHFLIITLQKRASSCLFGLPNTDKAMVIILSLSYDLGSQKDNLFTFTP